MKWRVQNEDGADSIIATIIIIIIITISTHQEQLRKLFIEFNDSLLTPPPRVHVKRRKKSQNN